MGLYIITGKQGSGKTTLLRQLSQLFRNEGLSVAGLVSIGWWEGGERAGFSIQALHSEKNEVLATTHPTEGWLPFRRFWFNPQAIETGKNWLHQACEAQPDAVIIDEIGPLELSGGGWADALAEIFKQTDNLAVIITIRKPLLTNILEHWQLTPSEIFNPDIAAEVVFQKILKNAR